MISSADSWGPAARVMPASGDFAEQRAQIHVVAALEVLQQIHDLLHFRFGHLLLVRRQCRDRLDDSFAERPVDELFGPEDLKHNQRVPRDPRRQGSRCLRGSGEGKANENNQDGSQQ